MSQITKLNLDDFIQGQFKNNTEMVVRLNDGSIIFVDEQALDKNKMSDEGCPVKTFGVRYRVMSDDMKTVTAKYLIPNEVLSLAKTRGKEFAGIKLPVGILTNENIGDAHEKFKVRLFYDDISEKPDLYNAIASKDSISGLILSSREAEWSELPVDFRKKFIRLTVPRFSDEEMEQLILKTLEINAILHDIKALKTLVSYAQGSPIYVGSLIKEMAYNGIRRLSETYLKENAQKGMGGYVIMILQRLLKSGNEYRAGGLHTLSCLMFLANHIEERKCHEQLLRAFANEIDSHMEEKFDDVYDRRTFNRSIDYLSGEGSLVRFPHDTWVDILQGQGASNPFRPDIQEIRKEFEDTGRFEELKKDAIADAWEAIQKRYRRNNVREKDSFLELCDTLTSNFRLSDLKEKGVDIDMIREVASKHRDELVAATILSRLEGAEPTHSVINIQDSVINRSEIGDTK